MQDEMMLMRAKHGDSTAFEQLVTPHETKIWQVCYRMMGNIEDAKDAMQETMLKAWRSLDQYRADASLFTWLYRVAVSCCTDLLRKRKRHQGESMEQLREDGFEPADATPGPAEISEANEDRQLLRQALAALPEEQCTVLLLTAVEGKSYEEAAAMLGLAMGTVKSRVNRARGKLKEILETVQHGNHAVSTKKRRGKE